MKKSLNILTAAAAIVLGTSSAHAVLIGGVDFPQGALSFADKVIKYTPAAAGGTTPSGTYSDPNEALGVPDWNAGAETGSVSLGQGGILDLQFVDNLLTGSGDSKDDLWIFEIGSAVEATFVYISKNGSDWLSVGKVAGAKSGIDIDAFGYGLASSFSYVRLVDDKDFGPHTQRFAGADIDAVGAISTIRNPDAVPDSTSTALALGAAFLAIGVLRKRMR